VTGIGHSVRFDSGHKSFPHGIPKPLQQLVAAVLDGDGVVDVGGCEHVDSKVEGWFTP
jgi:hypothetical protein